MWHKHAPINVLLDANYMEIRPTSLPSSSISPPQTAPVVVNTKVANIVPPSSKLAKYQISYVLIMVYTWD
jgi:hypothetical protein